MYDLPKMCRHQWELNVLSFQLLSLCSIESKHLPHLLQTIELLQLLSLCSESKHLPHLCKQ